MIKRGDKMIHTGKDDAGNSRTDEFALMPEQSLRPSWRQVR
jgi:hypothetical protein